MNDSYNIVHRCFNGDFATQNPFQEPFRRLHQPPVEGLLCGRGILSRRDPQEVIVQESEEEARL